ncbi:MAG: PD-(D/E)XK nuclease domain-containing protein [Bacteroidales bacterium]
MLERLFLGKVYYIKTEYEAEGGYMDIALLPSINLKSYRYFIIELNYIVKEKFS